ncbi:MAG: hypothetical protein AMJ92_13035 [candidate division Zixibacteria bacterium SM23_81]|nr:MAG: hypothetical protein AMJ92_13035 [candidate division Zixibacteria bacterium SM23_81]
METHLPFARRAGRRNRRPRPQEPSLRRAQPGEDPPAVSPISPPPPEYRHLPSPAGEPAGSVRWPPPAHPVDREYHPSF